MNTSSLLVIVLQNPLNTLEVHFAKKAATFCLQVLKGEYDKCEDVVRRACQGMQSTAGLQHCPLKHKPV